MSNSPGPVTNAVLLTDDRDGLVEALEDGNRRRTFGPRAIGHQFQDDWQWRGGEGSVSRRGPERREGLERRSAPPWHVISMPVSPNARSFSTVPATLAWRRTQRLPEWKAMTRGAHKRWRRSKRGGTRWAIAKAMTPARPISSRGWWPSMTASPRSTGTCGAMRERPTPRMRTLSSLPGSTTWWPGAAPLLTPRRARKRSLGSPRLPGDGRRDHQGGGRGSSTGRRRGHGHVRTGHREPLPP